MAAIVEREDSYPLAPLQHGMLFHRLARGAHTGVDIEQLDVTFRAAVDVARLVAAWEFVAARHPALRTRFSWEGLDTPQQDVMTAVDVPVVRHDLSALPAADRTAAVARFLDEDRLRGFDLNTAPLWRVTLFDLGKAGHRMVWTFSHAILDGSYTEVVREVFDAYAALGAGVTPRFAGRPSYRDQIAWLQQDRSSRAEIARGFWRARLSGFVKPSTLDGVQCAAPLRRLADRTRNAAIPAQPLDLRRPSPDCARHTASACRRSSMPPGQWSSAHSPARTMSCSARYGPAGTLRFPAPRGSSGC